MADTQRLYIQDANGNMVPYTGDMQTMTPTQSSTDVTPLNTEISNAIAPKTFGNATAPGSTTQTSGVNTGSGNSGSSGSGYGSATTIPTQNPASVPGSSSGGGGSVGAVFDMVNQVFGDVLGVVGEIRAWKAQSANEGLANRAADLQDKAFALQKKTTAFNQGIAQAQLGIAQSQLGLQTAQTGESLAGAGQARAQSSIAFNESQKDRRSSLAFLKGVSQGIAQGLATRPTNANLSQPGQPAAYATTPTLANPTA